MIAYRNKRTGAIYRRGKASPYMDRSKRYERVQASSGVQDSSTMGENTDTTPELPDGADDGEPKAGKGQGRGGSPGAQRGAQGATGGKA